MLTFFFTNALMTLLHYAFSRQHRTQFSEDVYAFVLWRYVAVQIWRVKELFVPGIVVSTIKRIWVEFKFFGQPYKWVLMSFSLPKCAGDDKSVQHSSPTLRVQKMLTLIFKVWMRFINFVVIWNFNCEVYIYIPNTSIKPLSFCQTAQRLLFPNTFIEREYKVLKICCMTKDKNF